MVYTNSYKEPESPTILPGYFGPEPYDINWAFPLYEETLESERVKLTPFIPSLHAKEYAAQASARPDLHRWFPFDLTSLDHILTEVELRMRRNPSWILFAIIDKARGGAMAGVIGLIHASAQNLSAEIAWVLVFPAFQRTYVTSNAVGILLQYTLELPSPDPGSGRCRGLGLRRVQWTAHSENKPSHAAARRMGFKEEGVLRWSWALHEGGEGHGIPLRDGDPLSPRPGRHSALFAICADDWENGGREHVKQVIDRRT
jgi:RimJ/RimL family protein N-acetyltransferase